MLLIFWIWLSQFVCLVGRICGVRAEFRSFRKNSANPDISRKYGSASRIFWKIRLRGLHSYTMYSKNCVMTIDTAAVWIAGVYSYGDRRQTVGKVFIIRWVHSQHEVASSATIILHKPNSKADDDATGTSLQCRIHALLITWEITKWWHQKWNAQLVRHATLSRDAGELGLHINVYSRCLRNRCCRVSPLQPPVIRCGRLGHTGRWACLDIYMVVACFLAHYPHMMHTSRTATTPP